MHTNATTILVTGGAGFIGAHMSRYLQHAGFQVVVLDNLSTGHREAIGEALFIEGDIGDEATLTKLFTTYHIACVFHFAAFINVRESMQGPQKYLDNNVEAMKTLLQVMEKYCVKNMVFSSSASVYGEPTIIPIHESQALNPINPYGLSKKMGEELLQQSPINHVILRYFNAAGADPTFKLWERHEPEFHLIPLILKALAEDAPITIYGNDYATSDGSAVRDYVHVKDICMGHLRALHFLQRKNKNIIVNLGAGVGSSVQEVIRLAEKITGKPANIVQGARRVGDPAQLIADISRANHELQWQPKHSDLTQILQDAWQPFVIN